MDGAYLKCKITINGKESEINLWKSGKIYYLRKVLLMGNNMCKRDASRIYLNVNALPVNAQSRFSHFTITVGHFLH